MVPSPQAGRGLAVVRRRRLLVEGGALVLVCEAGRREVLAAPGEVVAAWWTPVAAAVGLGVPKAMTSATVTDVVVVQRREGSPLVLRLADWLPASRRTPFDVVTGAEVAGWPGPPEEPSLSAAVRLSGVGWSGCWARRWWWPARCCRRCRSGAGRDRVARAGVAASADGAHEPAVRRSGPGQRRT